MFSQLRDDGWFVFDDSMLSKTHLSWAFAADSSQEYKNIKTKTSWTDLMLPAPDIFFKPVG